MLKFEIIDGNLNIEDLNTNGKDNYKKLFHTYKGTLEYFHNMKPLNDCKSLTMSYVDEDSGANIVNSRKKDYNGYCSSFWALLENVTYKPLLNFNMDFNLKKDMAIWRGSSTGNDMLYRDTNLWKYSRLELPMISKKYPELLDAGFTNFVQYMVDRSERFRLLNLSKASKLDPVEQSKYKYIVVADGNVATYGLFWALFSGSVILKQESDFIMYIEDEKDCHHEIIKEGVHYVSVKKDFSDLIEKIKWLQENQDIASSIARNSREYALKYFNVDSFREQIQFVINKNF